MRKEAIACDGCGREKQATNHWFTDVSTRRAFAVTKGVDTTYDRHFCSQGCASAAFQQWMDTEIKGYGE